MLGRRLLQTGNLHDPTRLAMNMKTTATTQRPDQTGSALMLTMIMSAVALALLAGAMSWSASNTQLTYRSIQYNRSVAAAEAATEKVVSQINRDFLYGGESLVINNLSTYRQNTVPSPSDSSYWSTWEFDDGNGNIGQTYVQPGTGASYIVLELDLRRLEGVCLDHTRSCHTPRIPPVRRTSPRACFSNCNWPAFPFSSLPCIPRVKWKSVAASLSTSPDGCIPTGNSMSNRTAL